MPDKLADFPYVSVRLACRKCSRKGSYRLARLALRYRSEIGLPELLALLVGECDLWETNRPWKRACGAFFVNLEHPKPPDLPAAMTKSRLIKTLFFVGRDFDHSQVAVAVTAPWRIFACDPEGGAMRVGMRRVHREVMLVVTAGLIEGRKPSVPMKMRQRPAGSLPLRA